MTLARTIGRFLLDHPVICWVPLILGTAGGCAVGGDEGVLAEPLPSPDGGEVWAAGVVDSLWLAVGPGGTYTSLDEGRSWRRVGPPPRAQATERPEPLSIHVAGRTLFLNAEGGVYRTTDAGRTWDQPFDGKGQVFLLSGKLYALTAGMLRRSPDEGGTWSDVQPLPWRSESIGSVAEVVTGAGAAYVSNGWNALRSVDGGVSWQSVPGLSPPTSEERLRASPDGPGARVDHAVLRDTLYALVADGTILRSPDFGITWSPLPGRVTRPRAGASKLLAAGDGLWVSGDGVTCRVRIGGGGCDVLAGLPVFHGIAAGPVLLAATAEGPWRSTDGGTRWAPARRGIPARVSGVAAARRTYFAAANRQLFRSTDSARAWTASRTFASPLHTMWTDGDQVFAFTADSLVACDASLRDCETRRVRLPAETGDSVEVLQGTAHQLNGILRIGGRLRPSQRGAVLRSENHGRTWRVEAFAPDPFIQRVWAEDSTIYALADTGIVASRGSEPRMRLVAPFRTKQRTVMAVAGGRALLATEEGTLLAFDPSDRALRPLTSDSLLGRIDALWTSARRPEIVVAATEKGLAWSKDGGKSFRPGRVREGGAPPVGTTRIAEAGDKTLLAGTGGGIYRLRYDIAPASPVERLWKKYWKVLLAGLLAVIGFVVLLRDRSRRGNIDRSYGVLGMLVRRVPNWARVRTFFRFYDRFLAMEPGVGEAELFFALPALGPDRKPVSTTSDSALVTALAQRSDSRTPVLLVGGGGAGKSTVLNRIEWLYLKRRLPEPWAGFRPVMVHASDYHDSLPQAVATVLRDRYGIDVDKDSVLPLLASEPLLILFDGASEIEVDDREDTYARLIAAAASHDFATCRVVIATRPIQSAIAEYPAFNLLPLTLVRIKTEILAQYGLDEHQQARVFLQLKRLGSDGVTPLLLHMAVEAARGGRESASEAGLYERYFRKLLRIEDEPAYSQWLGWSKVLSVLAGESVIGRGKRGVGFLHEPGIESVKPLIADLKSSYEIKGVPDAAQALNRLAAARILVRNGRRWRFAHDRFEEYFAAVYFVRAIEDRETWPTVDPWMASSERIAEFTDVLRFAVELLPPAEIRRYAPEHLPQQWRAILEAPPPDPSATADGLAPEAVPGA